MTQLESCICFRESDAKFAAFVVNKPQTTIATTGAECTEWAEALTGGVEPGQQKREGVERAESVQTRGCGTRDLFIDTAVYTRNRCVSKLDVVIICSPSYPSMTVHPKLLNLQP